MMGPVIVGIDGPQSARDAIALGRLLADLLDTPLDLVTGKDPSPGHALAEAAAGEQASLAVLGATHRHAIARVLKGTACRLLHESPCPVAVAAPRFADRPEAPLQRIGVGYEPTPEAHEALMVAHDLAARAGADLRAIGVVLPLAPIAIDDLRDCTAYYEAERRAVEGGLGRALARLPAGPDFHADPRVGDPAAELASASDELDLLVCGSRGRGPLRALLLGSLTERLLRSTACPLLIVPRPARAASARAAERKAELSPRATGGAGASRWSRPRGSGSTRAARPSECDSARDRGAPAPRAPARGAAGRRRSREPRSSRPRGQAPGCERCAWSCPHRTAVRRSRHP
jgi:nucleotide-binding universal stress UspA family protein